MTYITLVILNLAEVAVEGAGLVGTEFEPGDTIKRVLEDLISDSKIVNYGSPKLVGNFEHPNGGIDLVYRIRTASRALSKDHTWVSVEATLTKYDRMILEQALESEQT